MSLIRPEVRAGWRAFSAPLEGIVSHPYLDVRGLVTTGIGCLIDPVELALVLPWRRASGSLAHSVEVRVEWARVKAMDPGLPAQRYRGDLWLPGRDLDALLEQRLEATASALWRHFPELPMWPADAQRAVLSMGWAMGGDFPRAGWPRFTAAVRGQDWAAAARECAISTQGNAGVAPRNRANRALFLQAAEGA